MQPITDPSILAGYLTDASNLPGHASALYRPRTAEEAAAVIRGCQARGEPLTVAARRTSTTGASVPMGGAVLSTELLVEPCILQGDRARVGAGWLLGEFQARAEAAGWMFTPDPTSRLECSVGGAIACNASGARTYRYGPTRPWVESVEVVTPTGEILEVDRATPAPWPVPRWSEPQVKTAAGYFPSDNHLDLLIGAEGTLGLITAATVRLIPAPAGVLTFLAYFPDEAAMLGFLGAARAMGGRWDGAGGTGAGKPLAMHTYAPRCIEYFDRRALDLIRGRMPEAPEAHAALMLEVEHRGGEDGAAALEFWFGVLEAGGATLEQTVVAEEEAGRQRLHRLRHALPATVNEIIARNGVQKVGTDFSVPDAALPEMLRAYEEIPAAAGMAAVCFGHLGDNHLHLNLLPKDRAELARAREIYMELARRAVSLGGSVSAEHGIGRLKRAHLALMVPEAVREGWRAMRRAADPAGIFGRGVMLD